MKFYYTLQEVGDNTDTKLIIMRDFNGRIENDNVGVERWMGREGELTKNNNGVRLIEFGAEKNCAVANSKFRHKQIPKSAK